MLVLTRKQRQQISIGDHITVTVLKVKGNSIRLGIEAPEGVRVLRAELTERAPQSVEADEETEPPPAGSAVAAGRLKTDRGGQAEWGGEAERGAPSARRESTVGRVAADDTRDRTAEPSGRLRDTRRPMPPTDRGTRGLRATLR